MILFWIEQNNVMLSVYKSCLQTYQIEHPYNFDQNNVRLKHYPCQLVWSKMISFTCLLLIQLAYFDQKQKNPNTK